MVGHMTDYWRTHPPAHILVAGYMGYKPVSETTGAPELTNAITELAGDLRDDLPEHLRHALDAFSSRYSS